MKEQAICTIISKNYLPYARVLADSFRKHSEGDVYVLLVDKVEGYFKPEEENFKLIEIEELRPLVPEFDKFCFQYTILELNTAIKPYLLEYLFKNCGMKKLIYFDPDILITGNLGEIWKLLDRYSMVLTPHLTEPIEDNLRPREVDILLSGAYNLGFIALSNTDNSRKHISWWQKRLHDRCIVEIDKGLFVDQKWMDLVPGFYDDVCILREPGYNTAYWNYHCRDVRVEGEKISVNGKPSCFFHFSGFDPENIKRISKHQNRFTLESLPGMRPLFELYRDLVVAKGWNSTKKWPYFYDYFDNGAKVPSVARRVFLELGEKARKFANPFETGTKDTFFSWLNEPVDGGNPPVSRLLNEIHKSRVDLRAAFPDALGANREDFIRWVMTSGAADYKLSGRFLECILPEGNLGKFVSARSAAYRFTKSGMDYAYIKLWPILEKNPAITAFLRKVKNRVTAPPPAPVKRRSGPVADKNFRMGVNVAGYINSESGVGEAVRSEIRAMEKVGIPHVLINLTSPSRQSDRTYTEFSKDNPYGVNLVHVNADQAALFYEDKGERYFRDKYNIGFWVWELSDFPSEWVDRFCYFNEIWTPSTFCADTLSKVSPVPVVRVPHSIEVKKLKMGNRAHYGIPEGAFVFLFMFDFLSYFERKNPLAVIEAFKGAFNKKDEALLLLKCSNPERNPEAQKAIAEATKGVNVKFLDNYLSKEEINGLMSLSDCYVSLHRSEGFGLPIAEAMCLGKPVIATAYSGNMDFMDVNNSLPVKYSLVEIKNDVGPYRKGNIWAQPDVEHAAELMRLVYENRGLAKELGETASRDIKAKLSPDSIGRLMFKRFERISEFTLKSEFELL